MGATPSGMVTPIPNCTQQVPSVRGKLSGFEKEDLRILGFISSSCSEKLALSVCVGCLSHWDLIFQFRGVGSGTRAGQLF